LAAIDVDGTLVNSEKKLTAVVKKTIAAARQKNIKIVICTGRPFTGIKSILAELALQNQADQYVICFGGALVQKTNGRIINLQPLAYESYLKLEVLARMRQLHFQAVTSERIYTANRNISRYTAYESLITQQEISYRTPAEMPKDALIKAMIIDEKSKIDSLLHNWAAFAPLEKEINFCQSSPNYIEANALGVNKGSALQVLCQYLQLQPTEVMAIGDQGNDLSMLKYAGVGVAMGNATLAVKAAASYETADNDHDGVAWAIEHFCLDKAPEIVD
jgi:Cof subfamily protein (haloacid dehalogenase superfamily)